MKRRIANAFGQAHLYDQHAGVQKRVAERLASLLQQLQVSNRPRVLEVGCGTGFLAEAAQDSFSGADWLMTDIAPEMVERSRARFAANDRYRFAVMDGEYPSLSTGERPFDLVCSSLAAQWFDDLEGGLTRLFRLLAPGGHLVVATLAEGSFTEWLQAHAEIDATHGVRDYPEAAALRGLCLDGCRGDVRLESFIDQYSDGLSFLRALADVGAGTPRPGHRPLGAAAMRRVLSRFEKGGVSVSYRVAFCHFSAKSR